MMREHILHDAILLLSLFNRQDAADVHDMFANIGLGCDHLTSEWERGKAFAWIEKE